MSRSVVLVLDEADAQHLRALAERDHAQHCDHRSARIARAAGEALRDGDVTSTGATDSRARLGKRASGDGVPAAVGKTGPSAMAGCTS